MLFQRTQIRFPELTWHLTTLCNSNTRRLASEETAHRWCTYEGPADRYQRNRHFFPILRDKSSWLGTLLSIISWGRTCEPLWYTSALTWQAHSTDRKELNFCHSCYTGQERIRSQNLDSSKETRRIRAPRIKIKPVLTGWDLPPTETT